MIRGYFSGETPAHRPSVRGKLSFDSEHETNELADVEFLVDTGADTTVLSPADAIAVGIDTSVLDIAGGGRGIGGEVRMRIVEATLTIQGYSIPLAFCIPDSDYVIPSLLGRDFMAGFALFMEESARTVVLLDRDEVERLGLSF